MNERIKELAKQAKAFIVEPEHASVGGVSEVSFDKYSDLAKFAELIVRECFKAAMIESKGHMNPIDLMKRMKERVGVEE